MKKYDKFIKKALKLGANDAKIIKTDSIVTSAWVRWKCRYGCDDYNSSLCCPPNTPNHKETRELLNSYQTHEQPSQINYATPYLLSKDTEFINISID
jgi:predicted metal-binding protein